MILAPVDVGEGNPETLAVEEVGDLGAGERLKGLEVLLLFVLLLVVQVGLKLDQRLILQKNHCLHTLKKKQS